MHWYFAFMWVCIRVLNLGFTDSCELPSECWDLNPCPPEKQLVLLTTKPSPQPQRAFFLKNGNQKGQIVLYYQGVTIGEERKTQHDLKISTNTVY